MSELEGRTVGEYQLIELIDRGGDTIIVKAFNPKMNRYAAVKILSPAAMQDPEKVRDFKLQSEFSAQIEHRNILPVFDFGEADGVIYRATRFVESGSLADHLSWFYSLNEALGLFQGIGAGLEVIHGKGMVHGNLKPTNVLLDQDKQPLLTDFGLAKVPDAGPTVYMSPEQVRGAKVDQRTDTYALGVLLYQVLTGEAPPMGTVASPRNRRPEIPEGVERVVLKAMAQDPEARFSSVHEFLNGLRGSIQIPEPVQPAVEPTPAPAQPTSPPIQPKEKRDTSWVVFLLGAIFILCLVVGAVYFGSQLLGDDEAQPAPTEEVVPTLEPPTEAPPEATEAPPEVSPPIELPEELPEVCSSIGGATGMIAVGLMLAHRKKKVKSDK
jgi:serine/threonine protein kinase